MKPVYVRDLWNYFKYRRICGNDESLNRQILDFNTSRPGLELSGYFDAPTQRIVVIGEKEMNYINKMMNEQQQYRAFDFLTNERTPMILISRDLPCPKILYDLAYQKNMPVFSSYAPTDSLIAEIISYLEEFFAEVVTLHGVLMQVYGRGVLITAESGMGKSEIALELIRKGHTFVADDRVDVYRAHNQLYGGPAEVLENLMEIRGVGVLNVAEMFGAIATTNKSSISCIIHLERLNPEKEYDRLGFFNQQTETILGITIPKMIIPVASGRSTATVIEAAISNNILRQKGIDSGKNFHDRLKEYIEANKEEK